MITAIFLYSVVAGLLIGAFVAGRLYQSDEHFNRFRYPLMRYIDKLECMWEERDQFMAQDQGNDVVDAMRQISQEELEIYIEDLKRILNNK